ncbi:CPL16 [Auxenochlorella protothecoides x Auxenochlorella symbiontica]
MMSIAHQATGVSQPDIPLFHAGPPGCWDSLRGCLCCCWSSRHPNDGFGTPRSISAQNLLDPRATLSSPQEAQHDVAASPSTWAPSQQHLDTKTTQAREQLLSPLRKMRNASVSSMQSDADPKHAKSDSKLSLLDDDDMCPTCLEGYPKENPKITLKCGHHYHLQCIYAWLERSQTCPFCGRQTAFDEIL